MNTENSERASLSYDELLQHNQALSNEIDQLNQQWSHTWSMYADTSRKLQVYSASIKAAVSSLLNHEFFWDSANQHEFLESINTSVDQVSELIVLLTLAFRAEEGSLALKRDPQLLQEILAVVQTNANLKFPAINLQISYPDEEKMSLVDYEYLTKALLLLIDVFFARNSSDQITITALEGDTCWYLDLSGIAPSIMRTIEEMHRCKTQPTSADFLSAENILRLHIACEIFHLQEISVEVLEQADQPPVLRLEVPATESA